jgi:hypothetical protein
VVMKVMYLHFISVLNIHDVTLHNAMLDSGASHNLMPKVIMIFGLGSKFLLVMVGLSDQFWLSLCIRHCWLLVFFQNHSLSRLRCSGVASVYGWVTILLYCLWLNEHIHYFLIGYGPTLSSNSLTVGR